MQILYCWSAKWTSSLAKLKVWRDPSIPIWYCKQPSGGLISESHVNWVTLISNDLVASTAANEKATIAESSSPTSIYTEIEKKTQKNSTFQLQQVLGLKNISTLDFSSPSLNPRPFNPGLFNHEFSTSGLFNPRLFNHELFIHEFSNHLKSWKVPDWKVWVWRVGLKSPGLECPSTKKSSLSKSIFQINIAKIKCK